MIVTVNRLARPVTTASFADITTKECTNASWDIDGNFAVQFAVNLSVDETRQVRVRCLTPDTTAETLLRSAVTAYTANDAYLALPVPTLVQVTAQTAALTRQTQILLRTLAPID